MLDVAEKQIMIIVNGFCQRKDSEPFLQLVLHLALANAGNSVHAITTELLSGENALDYYILVHPQCQ